MKLVLGIILLYILFVAALYVMQRDMIYFPDTSRPALIHGAQVVKVTTQDKQGLEAWYFAPKSPKRKVLVFFHGNAGNYGSRIYKVQSYIDAGYGVLLAEYRGYGGNSGDISEQGFYKDGRAYIDWLISEKGIRSDQIVLYGESIGSGTAVQMASEYDIAGLVLEAPFSSLIDVASKQYFFMPVKYLLKDKFMNIEKIGRINAPLIIMHGYKDKVIPFSLAQKLYDAASDPKEFVEFPQANHNNLYAYGASGHVLDFLAGISAKE